MKHFVLKLVDHKSKKVYYRVESDPHGRDSLDNYIKYSQQMVATGKIDGLLPHHKTVAEHLAKNYADVEQQIVAVIEAPDLKTARAQTREKRRQMRSIDETFGYTRMELPDSKYYLQTVFIGKEECLGVYLTNRTDERTIEYFLDDCRKSPNSTYQMFLDLGVLAVDTISVAIDKQEGEKNLSNLWKYYEDRGIKVFNKQKRQVESFESLFEDITQ